MKNILLMILVLSSIAFAASFDRRNISGNQEPVFRLEVPQLVIAATSVTEMTRTINLNGIIEMITVGINNNTGNATIDVEIRDSDGTVFWVENAIAESTTTVFKHTTESSTDINMRIPVTNTITISVSPSAAPGASTATIDIVLFGE